MATLYKTDGTIETVHPANGKEFKLEELQAFVGGYIEHVRTLGGKSMFVNEDGKRLQLAPNQKATELLLYHHPYDVVVGNAIVCEKGEVS